MRKPHRRTLLEIALYPCTVRSYNFLCHAITGSKEPSSFIILKKLGCQTAHIKGCQTAHINLVNCNLELLARAPCMYVLANRLDKPPPSSRFLFLLCHSSGQMIPLIIVYCAPLLRLDLRYQYQREVDRRV